MQDNKQHWTPRPWVARIEDHSFCDTGDVFTSFTVAAEGAGKYDCFAEVFTRNDDIYEAAANTRLIATAPEMYHALQKLVCVLDDCRSGTDEGNIPPGILDRFDEATNTCRAALQKARGEE